MHYNDQDMREFAATSLVPRFEDHAFTKPPTLQKACIAIVRSAALSRSDGIPQWQVEKWDFAEFHFETLPFNTVYSKRP